MVASNLAHKMPGLEIRIPESPVKWCSVSLSDVFSRNKRLEAGTYDIEARNAEKMIRAGKYGYARLLVNDGMTEYAFHAPRFKRKYVEKGYPDSVGFLGSSEMLDIKPVPIKFITKEQANALNLFAKPGSVLISCSGTIGNIGFVSKTLSAFALSQHVIKVECSSYGGYLYACLKHPYVQVQLQALVYGAVIQEIEPEHLKHVFIPDAPESIKKRIDDLIAGSYELRDASNVLIDEAAALLVEELQLPDIREFDVELYRKHAGVDTFSVKLSDMAGRADASYHIPVVDAIVEHMKRHAAEVTTVGDSRVSKDVVLPGRFKRVYVEEGYGVKFLGGKVMHQLDPSSEKYLSRTAHKSQLEGALGIKENSILTSARGSLGDVVLPSRQFLSWAISDNMMQILSKEDICGYVYIFLHSPYGRELIKRFTYGGVVDAIEPEHIKQVAIPLLKDAGVQRRINELALEANEKRYEAYKMEQQALRIIDEEVIFAK